MKTTTALKTTVFGIFLLLGSISLFAQQYHAKTNIQKWKAASGSYVNDINYTDGENGDNTGIIITPSYQVKPKAKMKNEDNSDYAQGYIQLKAKKEPATIIFPSYTGVKSFKVNIISGGVNRKITLFNGEKALLTFEGIGKTGATYTYDVPDSEQSGTFNFILKDQSHLLYICEIEIEKLGSSAVKTVEHIKKLYCENGKIYFEARRGELVEIYNSFGQLLYKSTAEPGLNSIEAPKGIIVIKVGAASEKIIVN